MPSPRWQHGGNTGRTGRKPRGATVQEIASVSQRKDAVPMLATRTEPAAGTMSVPARPSTGPLPNLVSPSVRSPVADPAPTTTSVPPRPPVGPLPNVVCGPVRSPVVGQPAMGPLPNVPSPARPPEAGAAAEVARPERRLVGGLPAVAGPFPNVPSPARRPGTDGPPGEAHDRSPRGPLPNLRLPRPPRDGIPASATAPHDHSMGLRTSVEGSRPASSQAVPAATTGSPTTIASRLTTGTGRSAPRSSA